MSKILVTGGAGFLGSTLVNRLVELGHEVDVMDDLRYGRFDYINKKVRFIDGDVRFYDTDTLDENYEYVYHFAAPSSIVLFDEDQEECVDITFKGFQNMFHFAQNIGARFVYPSTGSLYSGVEGTNSENSILRYDKMNSYAKTKYLLEQYQALYESNSVGVRIFAGYGPGERHKGEFASVPYIFTTQIKDGVRPKIFGDGTQSRDFVYQDDVINAIIAIAENATENVVNIGSGKSVAFNTIVRIAAEILKKDAIPEYVGIPNKYLEKTLCDTSIMKKYYTPKISIKEGIQRIVDSFLQ